MRIRSVERERPGSDTDRVSPITKAGRRAERPCKTRQFLFFTLSGSLLASAVCLLPSASAPAPPPAPAAVVVKTDEAEGPFAAERFTNISLDAIYGQTTTLLSDPAFAWVRATNALSYVRCYNWLGDGIPRNHPEWFSGCRVVREGPKGEPEYRWEGLERVLDVLVASGVKPVIVCGGIPDVLAAGSIRRNEGGAAVNRPKDYARYQDMITQMVRRLEKTYGDKEVRSWYFEVWSQPDHEGSWEGGRPIPFKSPTTADKVEPFTRLYDHFIAGATAADSRLRLGGPGLAGDPSFLRQFLEHCTRGKNAVTGKRGTRIDFISWNRYGSVGNILAGNAELRGIVETDFPELKGTEFVLSEHSNGMPGGDTANTAVEAARLAALLDGNVRSARGVDLLFRAGDLVDDHFDGSSPLVTQIAQNTVPLPAFRFYMLLSKMGRERVKAEAPAGVGVLATRPGGKTQRGAMQVLLYRYDPAAPAGGGQPVTVRLRLTGLPASLLRLPMRLYRIDSESSAPYETWTAAGKPRPAPGELGAKLVGVETFPPAEEKPGVPVNSGEVIVELKLPQNGVALVTLGAEPSSDAAICERGERLRRAEQDYALAAELQRAREYSRAAEMLRKIQKEYADTFWAEVALVSLVSLYELDIKSPQQAEAARQELLALPLDDLTRVRLLERLRVDAVRRRDKKGVEALARQIAEIEKRLAAQRQWPLRRYSGG
jgi:xylan 1,4-beta-xylosidase